MRLIYLDCKLLEVGTFYFHASHNAVAVLARSSSDKPHSKMLKQEVVKCKGLGYLVLPWLFAFFTAPLHFIPQYVGYTHMLTRGLSPHLRHL